MRIISKFHDYYDSAMGYGQDMSVVYLRAEEIGNDVPEEITKNLLQVASFWNSRYDWEGIPIKDTKRYVHKIEPFLLSVAGKPFLGYRVHIEGEEIGAAQDIYVYSAKDLITLMETTKKVEDKNWKSNKLSSHSYSLGSDKFCFTPKGIEASFKVFEGKDYTNFHVEWNAPLFMAECEEVRTVLRKPKDKVVINPCLQTIQFQKHMDAFTVFQEIDMFISGVLPQAGREMVEISNDDKVHKAGFDKWSFRKKGEKS